MDENKNGNSENQGQNDVVVDQNKKHVVVANHKQITNNVKFVFLPDFLFDLVFDRSFEILPSQFFERSGQQQLVNKK